MSYIYVASPYTHKDLDVMEERHRDVEEFCADMLRAGKMVFSPIVHCHELACRHDLPKDFDFWMDYAFAMLRMADNMIVLCLDGWTLSRGVQEEILFCQKAGIDIVYVAHADQELLLPQMQAPNEALL